jgi:hypothetical protein
MRFQTTLQRFGPNNTGSEVPDEVVEALGRGRRPKVVVTVNGYTYRSTVAPMGGKNLIPFASEHRAASGIAGGDAIDVEIVADDAPREVVLPDDLAGALAAAPEATAFFDGLSYTNRRAYVLWIEDAKKPETRAARVAKAVEMLAEGMTR